MKTVLINASPKKRFSASSYLLELQRTFIRGEKVSEKLRNRGDYSRILAVLADADTVIFGLPLYVDGLPSHVLPFLKEMEEFCREKDITLNVYCVANNGFIEGRQNEPLLRVLENFCVRSGLKWCGGIGIGGGVMLNVTQILFLVNAAVLILNILLGNGLGSDFFLTGAFRSFWINTLILLFLNAGALYEMFRMGRTINKGSGRFFGRRYTRILLPLFVFILFADIFFVVISVFSGGMFRGWLAKKR